MHVWKNRIAGKSHLAEQLSLQDFVALLDRNRPVQHVWHEREFAITVVNQYEITEDFIGTLRRLRILDLFALVLVVWIAVLNSRDSSGARSINRRPVGEPVLLIPWIASVHSALLIENDQITAVAIAVGTDAHLPHSRLVKRD